VGVVAGELRHVAESWPCCDNAGRGCGERPDGRPVSGRSTAGVVRVPVGGGTVTVFAGIFRITANRSLRSRPSGGCHTDFSLVAGIEWIGNKHHPVDDGPLTLARHRAVGLALGLSSQPFGLRRGEVDRQLDGIALNRRGAFCWVRASTLLSQLFVVALQRVFKQLQRREGMGKL